MIRNAIAIIILFIAIDVKLTAQPLMKEHKVGHIFYVSLPDYMSRTLGLNDVSVYQYKSVVKDVYGFIIEDDKEELALAELKYASINEFFEDFIKDFLKDEDQRKISKSEYQKKGDISFVECDASYYDKEAKIEIYYLAGVVETKYSYYKVISWCEGTNKAKFKADFQKILYSFRVVE
jgi:hypothetical protein